MTRRWSGQGLLHAFYGAAVVCAVLWVGACRDSKEVMLPPPEVRMLDTASGFQMAVFLYSPVKSHAPGLVLLHAYRGDHNRWAAFAEQAREAGYWVAAVDLPGHGHSHLRKGAPIEAPAMKPDDWMAVARDLGQVAQTLTALGADPDNIAIAGEDLGANLALQAIHENPQYQAVVLVSPGLDYHGVASETVIRDVRTRPILILAAENDAYAAASAESLKNAAPGFSELQVYAGTAHGADLFASSPASEELALHWLSKVVGLAPD